MKSNQIDTNYEVLFEMLKNPDSITGEIKTDTMLIKADEPERLIEWFDHIDVPNNAKPSLISFDDVDKHDFLQVPFIERIRNADYVHLYFDFDSIKSEVKYTEVLRWLDKVAEVFGPYSVGGYSNDEEFATGYEFRYYPEGEKFVSVHVVYYTTMIKADELAEIMKTRKITGGSKEEREFCAYEVCPSVDWQVYNVTTTQKFRHVLSDKIHAKNKPNNKPNHGVILNGLEPSTQIVQVRGNESLIPREQWEKVFPPKMTKTEAKKVAAVAKREQKAATKETTIDDIDFDTNKLIIFDDEEMAAFLSHFDPEFDNLLYTLAPLRYSPYSKEFLRTHLVKWYGQRDHSNGVENVVDQVLDDYNGEERTNRWFYSIIKHLPKDIKNQYSERYDDTIDPTINISTSTWTFEDIKLKRYDIAERMKLMNNLRGVVGFVGGERWFLKEKKNGHCWMREMTDEKCFKELRYFKPFRGNTKITLETIVKKHSMEFAYIGAELSKDNKDGIINLFQGYNYVESTSNDFEELDPFLKHVQEVVCNNDAEKYDYFMKSVFISVFIDLSRKLLERTFLPA